MRKFSERGYNNADKTVCRFKQRAFEICRLFMDYGLKAFIPYMIFNDFSVDRVSNGKVRVHFNLRYGWACVNFPVEVMNMDDDAVLGKFSVKCGEDLTYDIVEAK